MNVSMQNFFFRFWSKVSSRNGEFMWVFEQDFERFQLLGTLLHVARGDEIFVIFAGL